jgi:hypothetical protein
LNQTTFFTLLLGQNLCTEYAVQEKSMDRRNLLQGLLTVPLMGLVGGCTEKDKKEDKKEKDESHTRNGRSSLKVVLHGPFAVVLPRYGQNRVTAFVPFDPKKEHELRFPTPLPPGRPEKAGSFQFELGEGGLAQPDRPPYVDHGFDDVTIHSGPWQPQPKQYFVYLELPVPDVITYIPPAEGVLFVGGKPGTMPVTAVLEYAAHEPEAVRIRSKQHGEQKPLPAEELLNNFQKYWGSSRRDPNYDNPKYHQRMALEREFREWTRSGARVFYFGVGLRPEVSDDRYAHAIKFFNDTLLGAFPNSPDAKSKHLEAIGDYGPPCGFPSRSSPTAMLRSAVFKPEMLRPRLLEVASTDDCGAGIVIATPPK